ncbi:hypothetical protein [Nocardia sp. NPDC052566]|uniref:hypothetical protein n=1 Tax=Nocardia sp. NPDC052566 TaxID=3364330 RepID=UPI0037CB0B51
MPFLVAAGVTNVVTPMGVNKNGDQTVAGGTTNVKLTGWTVRSGYPNTVINTADELVANGPGAVVIRGRIEVVGNLRVNESRSFDVMRNDAPIQTFTSREQSVVIPDTNTTLAPGDRVWVRMTGTTFTGYTATIKSGATLTYLLFDLD